PFARAREAAPPDGGRDAAQRAADHPMTAEDEKLRKLLHQRFDSVLEEPIPARMHLRSPAWIDYARVAAIFVDGLGIALAGAPLRPAPPKAPPAAQAQPMPALAARAHYVYTREKR